MMQIMMCSVRAQVIIQVINKAWGQDGWMLAKFLFHMFIDWDEVKVINLLK